jgi:hypothetical protein
LLRLDHVLPDLPISGATLHEPAAPLAAGVARDRTPASGRRQRPPNEPEVAGIGASGAAAITLALRPSRPDLDPHVDGHLAPEHHRPKHPQSRERLSLALASEPMSGILDRRGPTAKLHARRARERAEGQK